MGRHSVQSVYDVKDDATDRSWRTLWQQLGIDILIAALVVITPMISTLDITSKDQWTLIITSLLKTIISTVVSYFYRLYVAPADSDSMSLPQAKKVE